MEKERHPTHHREREPEGRNGYQWVVICAVTTRVDSGNLVGGQKGTGFPKGLESKRTLVR